ncbi:MAG: hypothetical protein CSA22_04560 [Deltaproteobacteria bacterium]|nr:MAG: hypothetical protein CSA22_04560 [Deltaproteobacteria bacterium]
MQALRGIRNSHSWLPLLPILVLYCISMPVTITDYDAAEFVIIAAKGGIGHPPGYPFYLLILHLAKIFSDLFSLIPLLSAVSVACTFLSVLLIFSLTRAVSRDLDSAIIGVYGVYLTAVVWRAATGIEPFALNLFLASLCLYSGWKCLHNVDQPKLQRFWFVILGMSFGLSFCNHHSMAFMLPFAAIIWWACSENRIVCLTFFIIGAGIGLVPLVYFFSSLADGAFVWGDWSVPMDRFLTHVLRREYGTFSLSADLQGYWYNALSYFGQSLPIFFSYILCPFVLHGVFLMIKGLRGSDDNYKENYFTFGILISIFFTGIVFIALFSIPSDAFGKSIAERFFALPIMLMAFPISLSYKRLKMKLRSRGLGRVFVIIVIVFHVLTQFPEADRKEETFFDLHIRNTFSLVEDNAVVIVDSDPDYIGLLYGQQILNLNAGAVIIMEGMWNAEWYRRNVIHQLGLEDSASPGFLSLSSVGAKIENPVYTMGSFQSKLASVYPNSYPVGPLRRWTKSKEKIPDILQLFEINKKIFLEQLSFPADMEVDKLTQWECSVLRHYQYTWWFLEKEFWEKDQKKNAYFCSKYRSFFE